MENCKSFEELAKKIAALMKENEQLKAEVQRLKERNEFLEDNLPTL